MTMLRAKLAPAARIAVRLCKSARKFRIAERTATAVLPVPPATFCAASRIFCAWVCICAWVVTLRTVSFAAVRNRRRPCDTPRISRGAVLAVMAFSFARCRGKSAPRRGRCATSGSVPHPACFGLTPRSLAAWTRAAASFWRCCRAWVSANFRP